MYLKRTNKGCVGNYMKPENGDNKIIVNHFLFNIVSTKTQKCKCIRMCVCVYIYIYIYIYILFTL